MNGWAMIYPVHLLLLQKMENRKRYESEGGNKAPYREIIEDLISSNGHFF